MADYKAPKYVVIADALPKNPSGKILKRDLRSAHADLAQASEAGAVMRRLGTMSRAGPGLRRRHAAGSGGPSAPTSGRRVLLGEERPDALGEVGAGVDLAEQVLVAVRLGLEEDGRAGAAAAWWRAG